MLSALHCSASEEFANSCSTFPIVFSVIFISKAWEAQIVSQISSSVQINLEEINSGNPRKLHVTDISLCFADFIVISDAHFNWVP
jgi:hypothetical protein